MVKAAALYLALVISLVVSIILGSLIYLVYFYQDQQQRLQRWDILQQEVTAMSMLTRSNYFPYTTTDSLLLSPITGQDSIRTTKIKWGFFDAIAIQTGRQLDSLKQAFLTGVKSVDSTVLYMVDEDRPFSISGESTIQGVAFIPKSGIRPAFVDGKYYKGKPEMVDGKINDSGSSLPGCETDRIKTIWKTYQQVQTNDTPAYPWFPTVQQTFFAPTTVYRLSAKQSVLQDSIKGRVILIADSSVTVSVQAHWEDAILIAPHIRIEEGFSGQGQFFALDSLTTGKDCTFRYPSVLAVLLQEKAKHIGKLNIGENSRIAGMLLVYREKMESQKDILELGKNNEIDGDVICYGALKYNSPLHVRGSVYSHRLITQRPSSLYENYLIDINFERQKLHTYFLRPHFWSNKETSKDIVKWLN